MLYLLFGLALIAFVCLVPLPYIVYVLGLIAGIVLVVYGLFFLVTGYRTATRVEPVTRSPRRRYWY